MKSSLPVVEGLRFESVTLRLASIEEGHLDKGLVPYFHFGIFPSDDLTGESLGHVNFRIGDNRHIVQVAGHIGYKVHPPYRGRSIAYRACRAIEPFIRNFYSSVIVTSDPNNTASLRTIEKLGAVLSNRVVVPSDDPSFANGAREKLRFVWTLSD